MARANDPANLYYDGYLRHSTLKPYQYGRKHVFRDGKPLFVALDSNKLWGQCTRRVDIPVEPVLGPGRDALPAGDGRDAGSVCGWAVPGQEGAERGRSQPL